MAYIVYLDETGNPTLEAEDKDYAVFGLVLVLCDTAVYAQRIVPAMYQLKMNFFGHEGVILRSYDIRKQRGAFKILHDADRRNAFYGQVNAIMGADTYTLIATMIRKDKHFTQYGSNAANPYDLAMEFAVERLLPFLEAQNQTEVVIVAESRGKNEDRNLSESFYRLVGRGNEYVSAERFKRITWQLIFQPKQMNLVGMQMADLAAYPIARHALDPTKDNPAFAIVQPRLYVGPGKVRGLKIFP